VGFINDEEMAFEKRRAMNHKDAEAKSNKKVRASKKKKITCALPLPHKVRSRYTLIAISF
jgi:hypothetical protein